MVVVACASSSSSGADPEDWRRLGYRWSVQPVTLTENGLPLQLPSVPAGSQQGQFPAATNSRSTAYCLPSTLRYPLTGSEPVLGRHRRWLGLRKPFGTRVSAHNSRFESRSRVTSRDPEQQLRFPFLSVSAGRRTQCQIGNRHFSDSPRCRERNCPTVRVRIGL